MTALGGAKRHVPVLIYHSIADDPPSWIAPFTVSPRRFRDHLDRIAASGRTPLTVTRFVDGLTGAAGLPDRPVIITLDDGFADALTVAAPELAERGLPATLYVTTGALEGGATPMTRLPPAKMLQWGDLGDLEAHGIEIGSHTHTHPPLDVVPRGHAYEEIVRSKALLEGALGTSVRAFAYPHGFYDRRLAEMVKDAGYDSGAAVRNAFSSENDDPFAMARLMVMSDTPGSTISTWLSGAGARTAPFRVRLTTRAWRLRRRLRERGRSSPLLKVEVPD